MGARNRASEQGFTLIELMIAVVIFSVISLAAFSVLSTSQQTAVMNDQTVQLQRNVRLAMDLIARDIRMTGYGNPAAGSLAGCVNQLNATDQAVGADTGPDSISVMTVDQQIGTLAAQAPLPPATSTTTINVSGLSAGSVNVNDVITLEGAFTATVNAIAGSVLTLSQTIQNPVAFPAGLPVLRLTCVTYTVTGIGVTPPFQLLRNGAAIADGIESIQLSSVRQVRITVVGRAIPPAAVNLANNTWKDPTFTGGSAITAEDQVIASSPGIRRRALTRIVTLRDASQS